MFYYIVNNAIVSYTDPLSDNSIPRLTNDQVDFYKAYPGASVYEVLTQCLKPVPEIRLEDYKASRIAQYSQLSFDKRREHYDDYKLINAGLGVYSNEEKTTILNCVTAFRDEFYRLQGLVNAARSIQEIDNIMDNFDTLTW